jgi:hypothetical protein
MKIKAGIFPLKSSNVWIFTAPREYLPLAQLKSLMLKDIVVESNANTSLSISTLGTGLSEYNGLTLFIRHSPNQQISSSPVVHLPEIKLIGSPVVLFLNGKAFACGLLSRYKYPAKNCVMLIVRKKVEQIDSNNLNLVLGNRHYIV